MTPDRLSGRMRGLILTVHLLALLGGLAFAWTQWQEVAARQAAVDQARATVAQLDARLTAAGGLRAKAAPPPGADPFLQGASATIAGADLQERVVAAIRTAGGTVTSSQIDTGGATGTPPLVSLVVSCQLADTSLQGLLYNLESGAPSLFLDEVVVEAASPDGRGEAALGAGPGGLKLTMTVSAYWGGGTKS